MNPRPFQFPHPEFAEAVEIARSGRHGEAIARIERAVPATAHPSRKAAGATALSHIARVCELAGDRSHAEHALEVALRLRPRYADLHFRKARVLIALQRRTEARKALDAALTLNPRYGAARLERALLDASEGLVGEALDQLRALAQEVRIEEPYAFQQGLESLERADWEEAGVLLERALRVPHAPVDQLLERYREAMTAGEPGRAAALVRESFAGRDAYPDLHYLLGSAELKQGHLDDALASLARALELNPDFHAARVQMARTLEAMGAIAQAAEQVALVLQSEPGYPEALELHQRWTSRGRRPAVREDQAPKAP
ncbi:MAG: tetratricopeptide repeat protein [Candidatus Eisenbacteria bacterium]|nr:tetratricopeptide repeat protein [Candidatus Eisenbacteria bacterium]